MIDKIVKSQTSIRSRLIFIIIMVSSITLVISASMFTLMQMRDYRTALAENLTALSTITTENVKAALAFDNAEDANLTLSELDNDPRIDMAVIFVQESSDIFAEYRSTGMASSIADKPDSYGYFYASDKLHILHPIYLGDGSDLLGQLYLQANLDSLYLQLQHNLFIAAIIILFSLVFCFLLAVQLQKLISSPIHELSETTKRIRDDKDYGVRVDMDNYEEIDNLCQGFNEMLAQIEERDENLQKLASYDTLTGLTNRSYFTDILVKAIQRGERKSHQHAILFLDMDRFKRINDSLGHTVGDELLVQISSRFKDVLRGDDTVARLGGDEFTILLQEINDAYQAAEVAERIIDHFRQPFELFGHRVVISPSIGIVLFPTHGVTPEELMRNADTAMYKAKQAGGNDFCFFTQEMTISAQNRLKLEERLQHAVERKEILLHYQPQLSLANGNVVGFEALCRWNWKQETMISPNEFLPVADESGLIIPIGFETFSQALQMLKRLNSDRQDKTSMAINMSARQIHTTRSVERLLKYIDEYEIDPVLVEVEITEEALIDNTNDLVTTLHALKDRGIGLAIDDFGTGYSSLSYLKQFPFDVLKIDMSFIRDIEETAKNRNIVGAIIDMAHHLELQVVAEGVETEGQLACLRELGCDVVQGYYISRPKEEGQIWEFLQLSEKHRASDI